MASGFAASAENSATEVVNRRLHDSLPEEIASINTAKIIGFCFGLVFCFMLMTAGSIVYRCFYTHSQETKASKTADLESNMAVGTAQSSDGKAKIVKSGESEGTVETASADTIGAIQMDRQNTESTKESDNGSTSLSEFNREEVSDVSFFTETSSDPERDSLAPKTPCAVYAFKAKRSGAMTQDEICEAAVTQVYCAPVVPKLPLWKLTSSHHSSTTDHPSPTMYLANIGGNIDVGTAKLNFCHGKSIQRLFTQHQLPSRTGVPAAFPPCLQSTPMNIESLAKVAGFLCRI